MIASPKRVARFYFLLEWIGRRWGGLREREQAELLELAELAELAEQA